MSVEEEEKRNAEKKRTAEREENQRRKDRERRERKRKETKDGSEDVGKTNAARSVKKRKGETEEELAQRKAQDRENSAFSIAIKIATEEMEAARESEQNELQASSSQNQIFEELATSSQHQQQYQTDYEEQVNDQDPSMSSAMNPEMENVELIDVKTAIELAKKIAELERKVEILMQQQLGQQLGDAPPPSSDSLAMIKPKRPYKKRSLTPVQVMEPPEDPMVSSSSSSSVLPPPVEVKKRQYRRRSLPDPTAVVEKDPIPEEEVSHPALTAEETDLVEPERETEVEKTLPERSYKDSSPSDAFELPAVTLNTIISGILPEDDDAPLDNDGTSDEYLVDKQKYPTPVNDEYLVGQEEQPTAGTEKLDAWLMRRYSEELGDLDCVPPGTWTLLHEEYKLTYPSARLRYKTPNDLRDRRKGIQRVIDRREKAQQK